MLVSDDPLVAQSTTKNPYDVTIGIVRDVYELRFAPTVVPAIRDSSRWSRDVVQNQKRSADALTADEGVFVRA
jgi:hypothetical protein